MTNRRSILWLLIGICIVSVADYILLRGGAHKPEIVPRTSLLAMQDDLTLVELSRNGEVECVLTRTGRWRIIEPFAGGADESAVLRLVDALSGAEIEDSLGAKEMLKLDRTFEDFALAPPRISVRMRSASGESTIGFGDLTPSRAGVYTSVKGVDSVFIVPSNVLAAVDVPTSEFRQRRLFGGAESSVVTMDIKGGGEFMRFRREGEGWLMTQPTAGPAASTKIKKLLSVMFESRAADFVWPVGSTNEADEVSSALLAGYGLDAESAVSVAVKGEDGEEKRITFGNDAADGLVYALVHDSSAIVTVDKALKDAASLGSAVFADTRLFPYEQSQVVSLSITYGDTACLLAKQENGSWRMDSPVVAQASSDDVESLLASVLALRGADVDDRGVEVSVSCDDRKIKIARSSLGEDFSLERLRSLDILNIESSAIRRLSVTGKDTNSTTSVVFDRDRNAWNVESSPVAGTVKMDNLAKLLSAVNPLRAARVVKLKVTADDLSSYGLSAPRLTLAIDLDRKDSIRRNILVGERAEGGFYATVGASDAVFVLPYETFLDISQELVGE